MTDARQLLRENRRAEAHAAAQEAHRKAPDDVDAQLVLGITSATVGEAEAAAPLLTGALRALGAAGEARHWRLLAQVRNHLGDAAGEVEALGEASRREPDVAVNWLRLAAAQIDLGRREAALEAATAAVRLQETPDGRQLFVEAMRGAKTIPTAAVPLLRRALAEAWARAEVIQPIAIRLMRAGVEDLLPALLASGPIRDAELEQELTALRRNLLNGASASLDVRAGLALQGFINEYAWAVTPEETARVEALAATAATPEDVLTLAAYRPLGELPGADGWLAADLPPAARAVVAQQVAEPRRDRALAAQVPAMTPIRPGVSEAVQAQYEQNPYPRWVKSSVRDPQPLDRVLGALFPRARLAPLPGAASPEILVVGCGSGRHAVQAATRYAGARVLGVDLSRASLGYAQRKSEELGLTNVRYAQADLLELKDLSFDVIECVGVLHHMEDPQEGLRILSGLLRPGGVMYLGLYSRLGRRFLEPARRLAQTYPRTPDGVRALRHAVLAAREGDPLRDVLASGDFFSVSACRDLLMHAHEQELSIADLRPMMQGFRFLGFLQPPEVTNAYRAAYPDDPAALDLAHWEEFETRRPDTFRDMYQFWIQKDA